VIVYSYVSLPEGINYKSSDFRKKRQDWLKVLSITDDDSMPHTQLGGDLGATLVPLPC